MNDPGKSLKLKGLQVLVVEDEALVALQLEEYALRVWRRHHRARKPGRTGA